MQPAGFEKLSKEEYAFLINVPATVTVLIAGADNVIDQEEIDWAERIASFRTYKEDYHLREYYRDVEQHFSDKLAAKIDEAQQYGKLARDRNLKLSEELTRVNNLWPKMELEIAKKLYHSFRTFAAHLANSSDGVLGFGTVSPAEAIWVKLRMMDDPADQKRPDKANQENNK